MLIASKRLKVQPQPRYECIQAEIAKRIVSNF